VRVTLEQVNIARAKAFRWTYLGGLLAVRNSRRIRTGDYDCDRRQRKVLGAYLFTGGGGGIGIDSWWDTAITGRPQFGGGFVRIGSLKFEETLRSVSPLK
jgi:hypothetical protein